MSDIKDIITSLYDNPNISIGAHGTAVIKDPERKLANSMMQNGIMNRYLDLRRTVNLQDRGYIHAHGNILLENLLAYDYHKVNRGFLFEIIQNGKAVKYVPKEVELEQCSFLVGIPKDLSVIDVDNIYSGPLQLFDKEFAKDETELTIGSYKRQKGRPINPKYIIGYYMNGDLEHAVLNENFYGFSRDENGELQIDEEKIAQENERIKTLNQSRETITGQELGRETMEQQKDVEAKERSKRLFSRFLEKRRQKDVKERSIL